MPRVAILMVNGFDRAGRYAAPLSEGRARAVDWLSLTLGQIRRHTDTSDYEVLLYDNANWPEQRARISEFPNVRIVAGDRELPHAEALDFLADATSPDVEVLVTLDTDAFPIHDEWLPTLLDKIDGGCALVGVWRDEMSPVLEPFIHPSCLAIRRDRFFRLEGVSFAKSYDIDVGYNIFEELKSEGEQYYPLSRSNARNIHFLLGGIYGDLIYHQGSGSRFPRFWLPSDPIADERARALLQDLAFADLDRLIAYLRGKDDAELHRRVEGLSRSAVDIASAAEPAVDASISEELPEADLAYIHDRRLAPLFWQPTGAEVCSAWTGHVPFALWLVGVSKPYVLVELGTRRGGSYLAFCRAVVDHKTPTRCYAVDTWEGDPHAGIYGEEIFEALIDVHNSRYSHFSKLLRMTFDAALPYFADRSIDLLHVDGYHTYEAVQHDFMTWRDKLSPRAVVLFHDTRERRDDFGVWRFWDELREQYPSFEFDHSHGLGVLAIGREVPAPVRALCAISESPEGQIVKQRFAAQGALWSAATSVNDRARVDGRDVQITTLQDKLKTLRAQAERDAEEGELLRRRLAELERDQAALRGSTSWRATAPFRRIGAALPAELRRIISRVPGGRVGRRPTSGSDG